jgi:hypothetical protein
MIFLSCILSESERTSAHKTFNDPARVVIGFSSAGSTASRQASTPSGGVRAFTAACEVFFSIYETD